MISKDCFHLMTNGQGIGCSIILSNANTYIYMFTADTTWMKILPDGVERDIAARIREERSN